MATRSGKYVVGGKFEERCVRKQLLSSLFSFSSLLSSNLKKLTQQTTNNQTMAKVVSAVVLLSSATNAFIGQPITTSSRRAVSCCSFLNMAPGKEIEVVSQPDNDFLEKKG